MRKVMFILAIILYSETLAAQIYTQTELEQNSPKLKTELEGLFIEYTNDKQIINYCMTLLPTKSDCMYLCNNNEELANYIYQSCIHRKQNLATQEISENYSYNNLNIGLSLVNEYNDHVATKWQTCYPFRQGIVWGNIEFTHSNPQRHVIYSDFFLINNRWVYIPRLNSIVRDAVKLNIIKESDSQILKSIVDQTVSYIHQKWGGSGNFPINMKLVKQNQNYYTGSYNWSMSETTTPESNSLEVYVDAKNKIVSIFSDGKKVE